MKLTLVERAGASDAPRTANAPLQQILGIDKRNTVLSLFRDSTRHTLHVYYGAELSEVAPENKAHVAFRCLIGRLYNAGVKAQSLQQRLFALAEAFRAPVGLGAEAVVTSIAEREIFSHEVFGRIWASPHWAGWQWPKTL